MLLFILTAYSSLLEEMSYADLPSQYSFVIVVYLGIVLLGLNMKH